MRRDPLPKPYCRVRWLLRYLGYDPDEVATIVDQLRRLGTTRGVTTIDRCDRGPIEDLLRQPEV